MKKYFILYGLFLFFFVCINIQSQEINYALSDLLLEENFGYKYMSTLSDEHDRNDEQSKTIYYEFIKLYQNKKYKEAILKIEDAIKLVPHGVYYYYYGNCFMLINNYEYAEKAYLYAIKMFDWIFDPWWEAYYIEKDFRYTFDNNGMAREGYFTYYNLACTYSIINKVNLAFNNLKKALEYNYPDINHLFNDPDLNNMFISSPEIKNQIQKIYDNGFVNNFKGKSFEWGRASEWDLYVFLDDKNIRNESNRYFDVRFGTYEIKNYLIIARYSDETDIFSINRMSKLWKNTSTVSDTEELMEIIPDKDISQEINKHITDNSIENDTVLNKKENKILLFIEDNNVIIFIIIGFLVLIIFIVIQINVFNKIIK